MIEKQPTKSQPSPLSQFESAREELEQIVASLETDEVDLAQALEKFERGVKLTRQCQDLLKSAELRVHQLMADNETEAPFPDDDTENNDGDIPF